MNVPSTFTTGTISVTAVNGCGGTSMRSVSLTRLPGTPASIAGPASVCPNQVGVNFTTPAVTGVTQSWSVPTGVTLTGGQGTTSMTCTWGTAAGSVSVRSVNACGQSAALSRSVTLATCMEEILSDPIKESFIEIYPNPNTGQFTIRTSLAGEFQLLNSVGQTIELFNLGGSNPSSKQFNGLSAGVYYIRNVQSTTLERIVIID
jgi:hypothetical protein